MILVVDIGNTNIVLGVYNNDALLGSWKMVTKNDKTSDEYGMFIVNTLNHYNINYKHIKSAIISSVVPNLIHSFTNSIKKYFKINPIVIGPGIKTGLMIKSENPKEVGADRIAGAIAGLKLYGGPLIVISFGTATTYDVISQQHEFLYGITCPGIQISVSSLTNKAAKLPRIEIKKPKSILAKNTVTSIQAGVVYGCIGQTKYIIKKIKEESNIDDFKVIATGGIGKIISSEVKEIDVFNPQLILRGLKIIHDKNKKTT